MKRTFKISVLILMIIVSSTILSINTVTAAETTGNVHGTILNKDGDPIEDVKISIVLTNGDTEGPYYSDEDGYFRIYTWGTLTIIFEKEGYVTSQKTIQVLQSPKDDPVHDLDLGEITLKESISLSSQVTTRYSSPGNQLELEFTISNNGYETENILFYTNAPQGWDITLKDNLGEIESILLDPGSHNYKIKINIPETATEVGIIHLEATGSNTATLDITIIPKVYTDEIELKTTYLSISEEIGQDIELPLSVSNIGEIDKKVSLSADVPEDWEVIIKTPTNMAVQSLLLTSTQSEPLTIELKTPEKVSVGDYSIIVTATDVNGGILDTLELDVNLRETTSEIEVISSFSEVSIEAGSSITFPLVVWNKGEGDSLTLFTVPNLPSNWDASFISDDLEVASIRIPGEETKAVDLIIEPPKSVTNDVYDLTVVIESDDGTQYKVEYIVEVVGSYDLELEMSTLYTTSNIGDSVTYSGRVTNNGQTSLTTLYLESVLPDDWSVDVSPTQISTLEPRDSVTFNLEVVLPGDTEAGDYLITTQAISDQMESDETDVRITAKASNTWGYIGVGIAIVAIAGAVLLFRRFKRR